MTDVDALDDVVVDDRLDELPESARTIVVLLMLDGPLAPSTLARRMGCSERTVRRRLRDLERADLVTGYAQSRDARRRAYEIADTGH